MEYAGRAVQDRGNVYYVGAAEITSFLITSPKGHILIDSGFAETVPLIKSER